MISFKIIFPIFTFALGLSLQAHAAPSDCVESSGKYYKICLGATVLVNKSKPALVVKINSDKTLAVKVPTDLPSSLEFIDNLENIPGEIQNIKAADVLPSIALSPNPIHPMLTPVFYVTMDSESVYKIQRIFYDFSKTTGKIPPQRYIVARDVSPVRQSLFVDDAKLIPCVVMPPMPGMEMATTDYVEDNKDNIGRVIAHCISEKGERVKLVVLDRVQGSRSQMTAEKFKKLSDKEKAKILNPRSLNDSPFYLSSQTLIHLRKPILPDDDSLYNTSFGQLWSIVQRLEMQSGQLF